MRIRLPIIFLLFTCILHAQHNGEVKKRFGKYGYKENGKWIIRPHYDSVRGFSDDRAAVMKHGEWGFVDAKGRIVVKNQFYTVTDFHSGIAAYQEYSFSKWSVLTKDGSQSSASYDSVTFIDSLLLGHSGYYTDIWKAPDGMIESKLGVLRRSDSVLYIQDKYVWHETSMAKLISTNGNDLSPEFVANDSVLIHTVIVTDQETQRSAVILPNGHISKWYSSVTKMDSLHFKIEKNERFGVLDNDLKVIVPVKYYDVIAAGSNFILEDDSAYVLSDASGKYLSAHYGWINYLCQDYCVAKNHKYDSTMFIIDPEGIQLPGAYAYVFPPNEGFFRVIMAGDYSRYAYVNSNGKQITSWYDRRVTYHSSSGGGFFAFLFRALLDVATLGLPEMLGWFDGHSSIQEAKAYEKFPGYNSDYEYFYGTDFHNGLAIVSAKRKASADELDEAHERDEFAALGLIDTNGTVVMKTAYEDIEIYDSLFIMKKNGQSSCVTRSGRMLIKQNNGDMHMLGDGYIAVQSMSTDGRYALYYAGGTNGFFVTAYNYLSIKPGGDSLLIIKTDYNHFGLIDYKGNEIAPPVYNAIKPFENGKASVTIDSPYQSFFIDRKGNRIK